MNYTCVVPYANLTSLHPIIPAISSSSLLNGRLRQLTPPETHDLCQKTAQYWHLNTEHRANQDMLSQTWITHSFFTNPSHAGGIVYKKWFVMDVSGCSRNPVGGGSLYTSRCGVWKPAEAASCFVFRCVILVSDQTIIRNSAGTGPPPICCPVTEAFFLNSPSNPAPPPPPRDCLLHSLHRPWFFAGGATWHINCQCIVKMTVSHERRLASCVFFFVCVFFCRCSAETGGRHAPPAWLPYHTPN